MNGWLFWGAVIVGPLLPILWRVVTVKRPPAQNELDTLDAHLT